MLVVKISASHAALEWDFLRHSVVSTSIQWCALVVELVTNMVVEHPVIDGLALRSMTLCSAIA